MKQFTVSKLECMAIRKQDWLFSIMLLDYEKLEQLGFNEQARKLMNEHNDKEKKKWFGNSKYMTYDNAIEQVCTLPENREIVRIEKEKIKKRMSRYKLIKESDNGMYKKNEIIIQNIVTSKFYRGECDNYGGANWPPVTFIEVVPTTRPEVRYEQI